MRNRVVEKLLERLEKDNGELPESVAFTLWGTDNIKTYGESLAQVWAWSTCARCPPPAA